MVDREIAATSLTATVGTQTHAPRQTAPPRPGGALPEPWIDPRGTHPNNRWHGTIQPTQEELDAYDRAESLLQESQSRRHLRQQGDHDDALNSTEAHEPLSRCWVHEASYVRWYGFYIRNGETTEAADAMARYQAGDSWCRLCCLLGNPDDMTGKLVLTPGSVSHPDLPFHTTDADGHNDDNDPDDAGAAAASGATADEGHATEPHQNAQDTTDAGTTAANPPPQGQSDPTRTGAAHQPPATAPLLRPLPAPPPTEPPTPTCPPTPIRAPTLTPQQPPQRSRAPRNRPGALTGLLAAAAITALALRAEHPDRPHNVARTTARGPRHPPRLTLLGGALLLAAVARSLPKAASSPAPAPGADHTTPPLPLAMAGGPGAPLHPPTTPRT